MRRVWAAILIPVVAGLLFMVMANVGEKVLGVNGSGAAEPVLMGLMLGYAITAGPGVWLTIISEFVKDKWPGVTGLDDYLMIFAVISTPFYWWWLAGIIVKLRGIKIRLSGIEMKLLLACIGILIAVMAVTLREK